LLFRRNIEPSCSYCYYGVVIGYGEVICSKKGIMSEDDRCGSFRYEPTRRKPEYAQSPVASKIFEEDLDI
jgi:hypothetical protein